MINPKKQILAWLLHNANTNPTSIGRDEFYKIKDTILQRHGAHRGVYDFQHIQKSCWTCNGTGVYPYPSAQGQVCLRCHGTGWYTDFWVRLDVWEFGKYEFHKPVSRLHWVTLARLYTNEKISPRNIIDDYIAHESRKWSADCNLILFFLYAPKLFWRAFGRVGFGRKTPIAFLCTCVFELRLFFQRVRGMVHGIKKRMFKKQSENTEIDDIDIPF